MTNGQVAELLRAVAAAYQIENEAKNRFRIIAYSRAADAIEHLSSEVKDIWDEGKLADIAGIGESIATHLDEIFRTGKSSNFDKVLAGVPRAALNLLELAGVGPKRAFKLAQELKLPDKDTYSALKKYALSGDIAKIEGMGEEIQKDILEAIKLHTNKPASRLLLSEAEVISEKLTEWIKAESAVLSIETLGSLRREASTVGDIDLAVATKNPKAVIGRFTSFPGKLSVINSGDKSASILLPPNVRADLKVESPDHFGSLLQHFTGSKHHNVALREYALKKGLSLSEHGIKTVNKAKQTTKTFSNEKDFYNALGMDYIPPEIREGKDEIEMAIQGKLPKLVEVGDIKGDLQMHSSYDIETSHDLGSDTMEKMINKAASLGYEYIAFTEHNPSQKGHSDRDITNILVKKREVVNKINSKLSINKNSIKKVFNSLEIDILPNGALPVPEEGLETLDFALCSIHSSFKLSRIDMTKRVLSALSHPKCKIFAHPSARLLNKREGIELSWDEIFDYCLKNNKWIEINADPHRLDLPDFLVREAVKTGVKLTLGTDAHSANALANMKYGVFVARRGWATKGDIINTFTLKQFEEVLEK